MYYLCVALTIIWAISAMAWIVSAIINWSLTYFFFFVISDFICAFFFFLAIIYAKNQSVMAAANEWPQYHWNIICVIIVLLCLF